MSIAEAILSAALAFGLPVPEVEQEVPAEVVVVESQLSDKIRALNRAGLLSTEPYVPPEPEPVPHVHPPVPPAHVHPQVQVPDIATRVADCESGERLANGRAVPYSYNIRAENPVSTASGKYQFINGTWTSVTGLPAPASSHAESVQDQAFLLLWDNGRGSFHWNASRSCWG